MQHLNSLLTRIEAAGLWSLFHKDWLIPIRLAVREQLDSAYRLLVEPDYSLTIRRAPENHIVAVAELVSPSNKLIGNRLDQQKHLRKRDEYLDAGINVLEIDPLTGGERVLPDVLARLRSFDRVAWTAFHDAGRRRYRGIGWNQSDPLPRLDWRVDVAHAVQVDLAATLREAAEFNQWETLTPGTD